MHGRVSGIALVIGLAALMAGLFAIGLWPKWNALKTAQADAAKDELQAVMYVPVKRGNQKADIVLPVSLYGSRLKAQGSGRLRGLRAAGDNPYPKP